MTYIQTTGVTLSTKQGNASGDAFGRWRVSQVTTLANLKQDKDNLPFFVDQLSNGSATSVHTLTEASTKISTVADGDYHISQTIQRYPYQTGKSQQIFLTLHGFKLEANVSKAFGYFSSSTIAPYTGLLDGLRMEADEDGNHYFASYKTGVITSRVNRTDWYDSLDGNGVSGLDFSDLDGNTIWTLDFEWLSLGRFRWGIVHRGVSHLIHACDFTNGSARLGSNGQWVVMDANFRGAYMSTPNQPIRWEIRQNGVGSGELTYICATVGSEGSLNLTTKNLSLRDGSNKIDANVAGTTYAVTGVRLDATTPNAVVDMTNYSMLASTNDNFIVSVIVNPTVAGTFTYNDVPQYGIQAAYGTTANTVTGGIEIYSRPVKSGGSTGDVTDDISSAIRLGTLIDGTKTTMVLCVTPLSSNLDIYASFLGKQSL